MNATVCALYKPLHCIIVKLLEIDAVPTEEKALANVSNHPFDTAFGFWSCWPKLLP
jgi:hypothetical protein